MSLQCEKHALAAFLVEYRITFVDGSLKIPSTLSTKTILSSMKISRLKPVLIYAENFRILKIV